MRRATYNQWDLQRAVLGAALSMIADVGPGGITIREAARTAGVTHAAPYRHFASRRDLLAAVAEEGFRALHAAMTRALDAAGDVPLERLRALGLAYVRHAVEHPSHFRVMFGPEVADKGAYPGLVEAGHATLGLLHDTVRGCQRSGAVRAGDPDRMAVALWSLVHGLADLLVDGQVEGGARWTARTAAMARDVTTTIVDGLAAR
jgi:AcrR family transcriptional regulator